MAQISALTDIDPARFDRPDILKKLAAASRRLGELMGASRSPHLMTTNAERQEKEGRNA